MQHTRVPLPNDVFAPANQLEYGPGMKCSRRPGYYWVVFLGEWDIASWSGEWWEFAGLPDAAYSDDDLERIGPAIPHPEDDVVPESRTVAPMFAPRLVRQG